MNTSNDEALRRPSGDRWVRWRTERLRRAGFPEDTARRLAGQGGVDLHALLELVDRGCPPELAARILAPLDEPVEQTILAPLDEPVERT